ncbi:MAG: hypothetical protein ABIR65_13120, partial [Pseudolysinimonas sp.]
RRSRFAAVVGAIAIAVALSACVPAAPAIPTSQPQGPQPPADGPITLQVLATIVTEDDAPAQSLFDVGAASTSGADLLSEQDYWVAVGGRPEECRDVVSSPYLVSSADATDAARTDDPTGALGTYSEDEDLFGLVQVYGRIFDDEARATSFLAEFTQTVAACPAYQLTGDDGTVSYDAVGLHLQESTTAPIGTRQLVFSEDVAGSDILGVSTTFVQRKNAVIAIYAELYPSSTMTAADVATLTATITGRLAAL